MTSITFTDTEVNNCFSIKNYFISDNIPTNGMRFLIVSLSWRQIKLLETLV